MDPRASHRAVVPALGLVYAGFLVRLAASRRASAHLAESHRDQTSNTRCAIVWRMHAVVNHLRFKDPVDRALFARAEAELAPSMRAIPGFASLHIVQVAADHVVLVITGDDAQTLDRLATEVGTPWMRDNVIPLLAGPPERHIGPIIASASG